MHHASYVYTCRGTKQLGICTADGSLGLSTGEHVQLFFADPAAYCVGYGRMLRQSSAIPPATAGGAKEGINAVVDVSISESISQSSEGVTRGVAAITGTAVREVGETEVPVSAAAAVEPDRKEASVSRVLRKHSPGVASVEALDLWKGGGRSTNASITSATCSDLKVRITYMMLPSTLRPRVHRGLFSEIPQKYRLYSTPYCPTPSCTRAWGHAGEEGSFDDATQCCQRSFVEHLLPFPLEHGSDLYNLSGSCEMHQKKKHGNACVHWALPKGQSD